MKTMIYDERMRIKDSGGGEGLCTNKVFARLRAESFLGVMWCIETVMDVLFHVYVNTGGL